MPEGEELDRVRKRDQCLSSLAAAAAVRVMPSSGTAAGHPMCVLWLV